MSDQVGTTNSMLIVLILLALLIAALAIGAIFIVLRSRKKEDPPSIAKTEEEQPLETDLSEPLPPPKVMAQRFAAAMETLKQMVPGSNYRYRVPWFLLVGESGSGKTSILEHLSVGSPGADLPPGTPPALSRRWRFLDQAIVIDIPGEAFLARRGALTDRKAWLSFLRLLLQHRPKRPLEGIVLTIPATDLLDASLDSEHPERRARVEGIRERLREAQQQLGLNLPIYLLITKSDQIQGFSSFCGELPPEMQQDLFGWSNTHRLDTNFTAEWVDEAFDAIHETLLHRQMEILTGRPRLADPDGVFLFPFELQKLRRSLRVVLEGIFRASAYKDAPFFRGIYFCGIISPPSAEPNPTLADVGSAQVAVEPAVFSSTSARPLLLPEVESPHLVFVRHLFDFKVFLEYRIARPIEGGFFSRNRSILLAQALSLLLMVVLSIGTVLAYHRIDRLQQSRILPVLNDVYETFQNIQIKKSTGIDSAFDLMGSLDVIHQNEFRSVAMPYSYIDPVRNDLRTVLEQAFEKVVLQSSKTALEQRAAQTMQHIRSAQQSGTAPPEQTPLLAPALGRPFGLNPQYMRLHSYLAEIAALNQNISRYQIVSQAGSGSAKELGELLQYLGKRELPGRERLARDPYFENLLADSSWSSLDIPADYREVTAQQTLDLIHDFYQSWFIESPLIKAVDSLQSGLNELQSSEQIPSDQDLQSLLQLIQHLDNQLGSGSYDWIADNFSRSAYPALGSELDAMPFADERLKDAVAQAGTEAHGKLQAALTAKRAVLDISNGRVRLNGSVQTLGAVLASLTSLDFMRASNPSSQAFATKLGSDFVWKVSTLNDALRLYDSYSKTVSEMLPALPEEYRTPLEDVAADRISQTLSSAVLQARMRNPDTSRQSSLDTELQLFSGAIVPLQQIQDALSALGATDEQTMIKKIVSGQANSLLARVDNELSSVYAPSASAVTWSGKKPLSLYLYQADSPEDLEAYLKSERQRIAALGNDASPVVQYLVSHRIRGEVPAKWETINQDLKLFQGNKPGNPIAVLENFIQTDLDKITPENRCKANLTKRQADVFLNARDHLALMAVGQCRQVAVVRYNRIAGFFNQRLSGHFPFSHSVETRDIPEADPAAVAEFYTVFDQDSAGLVDVLPQASASPGGAVDFLQAMNQARPFVLAAAANQVPAVDLAVLFRANRDHEVNGNQIIDWQMQVGQQQIRLSPVAQKLRWHLGDPIQLVFRYAKDSPYVPVAISGAGFTVQDRTVTFEFSNLWSLYALLQSHAASRGSAAELAGFRFGNAPASNQGSLGSGTPPDTMVFVRIDLSSISAKPDGLGEKLTFSVLPAAAPKLSSPAVADGE
jgi:type VI secretion system protein ImpL